jgi:hypothetical protein
VNLASFGRYKGDVNEWASEWMGLLTGKDLAVVEVEDLIQEDAHCVFLEPEQFLSFCQATGQRAVFHILGEADVDGQIRSTVEKLCEDEEDPALLIKAFETNHVLIVKRARLQCPEHFYAEFFVLHQGAFVTTGVLCEAYDALIEALATFAESADDRREEAKQARLEQDAETLEHLADELLIDPEFAKIRGRRKRCVYVMEKYGDRVPKSARGELRRVDANHDPVDANLASLVERVSDRLELSKQ